MIDRFAFVRLAPPHATVVGRADALARVRTALAELPGLVRLSLGTPGDASAEKWDLSIVARFADLAALQAAMATVGWASVFDHMLPARASVVKAWTFEVDDAAPSPLR
ncbi:MAG TPA: hypothetical protein VHE35_06510 [Kofleriaceae bacterium]|nr:hypothetical protein [Kofleriaceae bacterium]